MDKEIASNDPIIFEIVTVNHGLGYNSSTGKILTRIINHVEVQSVNKKIISALPY